MNRPRWLRNRPAAMHVEVLRLQPGDVIIATVKARLRPEDAEFIKRRLERNLPGYQAMVLDETVSLSVARQQHLDHFTVPTGGAS